MSRFRFAPCLALALLAAGAARGDVMYVPPEIFVDEADVIVLGKVTKTEEAVPPKGLSGSYEYAVIEVKQVLKGPKGVKVVRQLQPALGGARLSHRVSTNVGEEGVWMLTRVPGTTVYRFGHPGQFRLTRPATDQATVDEVRKLIEARAKLPHGKEVNGLVARAEVLRVGREAQVRFSLRNVSKEPIVICDYVGHRPLAAKWVGADGKERTSDHYDWLKAARLRPPGPENFVTIPPGGVRFLGPRPGPLAAIPLPGAQPGDKVTVSYTNKDDGKQIGVQKVWTGTVTSNEVTIDAK